MKRMLAIWITGFLIPLLLSAQENKPVIARAGTDLNESVPKGWAYQYLQFNMGRVTFRNGSVIEAKLNYNWLLDEMHFLGRSGDTITLDQEETVRHISIGRDTFYFSKGYALQIASVNSLRLCIRQKIKLLDKQKTAAYDRASSVSAVKNVNTYSDEGRVNKVGVNETVVVARGIRFFFCDRYYRLIHAEKRSIPSLVPEKRNLIRKYLRERSIDLENREELENLLIYLAGL